MHAKITFVLGGARSGKSRFAEDLVQRTGLDRRYLATGQAFDNEMQVRIDLHQSRRGIGWTTVEEPLDIGPRLAEMATAEAIVLVDCLTLWLSNLMFAERDIDGEIEGLVRGLTSLAGAVVFVSNEVGLGIVPENVLARQFRDHQGRLNQRIAAAADHVVFIAAGLPLVLKNGL